MPTEVTLTFYTREEMRAARELNNVFNVWIDTLPAHRSSTRDAWNVWCDGWPYKAAYACSHCGDPRGH